MWKICLKILPISINLPQAFENFDHHIPNCQIPRGVCGTRKLELLPTPLVEPHKSVSSNHLCSNIGVPLGSIIPPLLFILHVKTINNYSVNSKFNLVFGDVLLYNYNFCDTPDNATTEFSHLSRLAEIKSTFFSIF